MTTTIAEPVGGVARSGKRWFARHFVEMLLAMLIGMGVLGGLAVLAFAAAGSSLSDQPGAFQIMLMGVNMTVPMVIWMGHRRQWVCSTPR